MSDTVTVPVNSHEGWHLDRRVPLAIIATIVLQTMGIVWWAAKLEGRVDITTENVVRIERDGVNRRNEDRAELKETLRDLKDGLRRIEEKLNDKADRPRIP